MAEGSLLRKTNILQKAEDNEEQQLGSKAVDRNMFQLLKLLELPICNESQTLNCVTKGHADTSECILRHGRLAT